MDRHEVIPEYLLLVIAQHFLITSLAATRTVTGLIVLRIVAAYPYKMKRCQAGVL